MTKKTNYSYVGIAFIILLFGIIFIPRIIDRISNGDVVRDGESRSEGLNTSTATTSNLAYLEINGERKKVPSFSFTSHSGKTITNKDYEGKVYIVDFFFTTCPTICPRMSKNLVEIQNELKEFQSTLGMASFTINPETDTQEVLKAYADRYGVTNPNWHLMTGDKAAIYELSNVGFSIFVDTETFEHSGNFALIDKEGYIRSRVDKHGNPIIFYNGIISQKEKEEDGHKEQITMLKEDIRKLLKE